MRWGISGPEAAVLQLPSPAAAADALNKLRGGGGGAYARLGETYRGALEIAGGPLPSLAPSVLSPSPLSPGGGIGGDVSSPPVPSASRTSGSRDADSSAAAPRVAAVSATVSPAASESRRPTNTAAAQRLIRGALGPQRHRLGAAGQTTDASSQSGYLRPVEPLPPPSQRRTAAAAAPASGIGADSWRGGRSAQTLEGDGAAAGEDDAAWDLVSSAMAAAAISVPALDASAEWAVYDDEPASAPTPSSRSRGRGAGTASAGRLGLAGSTALRADAVEYGPVGIGAGVGAGLGASRLAGSSLRADADAFFIPATLGPAVSGVAAAAAIEGGSAATPPPSARKPLRPDAAVFKSRMRVTLSALRADASAFSPGSSVAHGSVEGAVAAQAAPAVADAVPVDPTDVNAATEPEAAADPGADTVQHEEEAAGLEAAPAATEEAAALEDSTPDAALPLVTDTPAVIELVTPLAPVAAEPANVSAAPPKMRGRGNTGMRSGGFGSA